MSRFWKIGLSPSNLNQGNNNNNVNIVIDAKRERMLCGKDACDILGDMKTTMKRWQKRRSYVNRITPLHLQMKEKQCIFLGLDCISSYSLQDWKQLIGYLKKYFHQSGKLMVTSWTLQKKQQALRDKQLVLKDKEYAKQLSIKDAALALMNGGLHVLDNQIKPFNMTMQHCRHNDMCNWPSYKDVKTLSPTSNHVM